jgi:hypothetical protein
VKADADNSYNDYDQKIYRLDESTLTYKVTGAVGEEKEQMPVSMKGVVELVAFSSSQAKDLAKMQSQAKLPSGKELIDLDPDSVSFEVTKVDASLSTADLDVSYKAKAKANAKAQIIDKKKIIGLSESQLEQYLKNLPDLKSYTVEFSPSFIRQVPRLADRIEIKVIQ